MFVEVDSPFEKVETTFTETITEQTTPQRGAEWLDSEVPDWALKIDLSDFSLSSCNRCVCGYVFQEEAIAKNDAMREQSGEPDSYFDEEDGFTGYDWFLHNYDLSAGYLGFQADSSHEYDTLEAEWRELIAVRQTERA